MNIPERIAELDLEETQLNESRKLATEIRDSAQKIIDSLAERWKDIDRERTRLTVERDFLSKV